MQESNPGAGTLRVSHFGGRVKIIECPVHTDHRGILCALDFDLLPFVPKRVFTVSNVHQGAIRGGHAHRSGAQILICVQGRIEALLRFEDKEISSVLEAGSAGLLVEAGVWCQQRYLENDSVLLVLASEPYDARSYVHMWT